MTVKSWLDLFDVDTHAVAESHRAPLLEVDLQSFADEIGMGGGGLLLGSFTGGWSRASIRLHQWKPPPIG